MTTPIAMPLSVTTDHTALPRFQRRKISLVGDLFSGSALDRDHTDPLSPDSSGSISILSDHASPSKVQVARGQERSVRGLVPAQVSFEQKIFDALVNLKVAVATYAMHLSSGERSRIFARLDDVINIDDWHEEDPLPVVESFKTFLKWLVYSGSFDWSSIGVSHDGSILVAWSRPNIAVTANFSATGRVTWTARMEPADEGEDSPSHVAGSGTLQSFAEHARFYLNGGQSDGGNEHS